MSNPFIHHPKEVGLSYTGHFLFAWSIIWKLWVATFCCIIHSVFPFMFTHTTSTIIRDLHHKLQHRTGDHDA